VRQISLDFFRQPTRWPNLVQTCFVSGDWSYSLWLAGVTALHLAVQRGNTDAVRCLLSAGADVDIVDTKYGRTALYYAKQRNDMAAAQLLLSYGANPALATYSGCTMTTVQPTYSSKCSTDMRHRIQPAINYYQPPACCPTGMNRQWL